MKREIDNRTRNASAFKCLPIPHHVWDAMLGLKLSNNCECDNAGNAIAIVFPILHTLIIHILPSAGFVVIATPSASESRPPSPDSLYPQIARSLGLLL